MNQTPNRLPIKKGAGNPAFRKSQPVTNARANVTAILRQSIRIFAISGEDFVITSYRGILSGQTNHRSQQDALCPVTYSFYCQRQTDFPQIDLSPNRSFPKQIFPQTDLSRGDYLLFGENAFGMNQNVRSYLLLPPSFIQCRLKLCQNSLDAIGLPNGGKPC